MDLSLGNHFTQVLEFFNRIEKSSRRSIFFFGFCVYVRVHVHVRGASTTPVICVWLVGASSTPVIR